jgi:hypothetical protein
VCQLPNCTPFAPLGRVSCHTKDMKNTHLEHPEDSVLLGKESAQNVIKFLRERNSTVTVKWDGAPAIVFGTNPENGKFFVGTKSVFNKVKVKINYTHADIEKYHGTNQKVAAILHTCLEVLPKLEGIYQGDFIGYGGASSFTPNTITYTFPADSIPSDTSIVFACHTSYHGSSMKTLQASFGVPFYLKHNFMGTYFVNTDATITSRRRRVDYILGLASVVSNFVKYPTAKQAEQAKVEINKCIRENRKIASDLLDPKLIFLYNLIIKAKDLLMEGIQSVEQVDTYIDLGIDKEPLNHEGFVLTNEFGTFKLVNRRQFSFYNFTLPKNW